MSVVTGQARRRWAVMAAAVAVLLCLPVAAPAAATWAHGLGDDAQAMPAPRVLLERARASGAVPFSGLATSRGNLGLPDLPQVGDVAAALGGTTRTRIWWSAADRWRVDVLTPTGEQGTYDAGGRTFLWDYEQSQLTAIDGDQPQLRLPRADDLAPPQAARRLLAGSRVRTRCVRSGAGAGSPVSRRRGSGSGPATGAARSGTSTSGSTRSAGCRWR